MRGFLIGLIAGMVLVPLCMVLYFASGRAPVATDAPPLPMESTLAKLALHKAVKNGAPRSGPVVPDTNTLKAGAQVYLANCAGCHGLPGLPPPIFARGMFPRPPQLFKEGDTVTDDPPGETFWKVKNGIRLTGMPAFKASLSEDVIWQVTLLLANADKLPPEAQQTLNPGAAK
jgi:thiosulfate dehydrogenase